MGIRIHTVMGFGLTDVKFDDDYNLIDDRFNLKGEFIEDWTNEFSFEAFKEHINQLHPRDPLDDFSHKTLDLAMLRNSLNSDDEDVKSKYYSVISHDVECLPNVMCFTPLTAYDWKRYDDSIDYYMTNVYRDADFIQSRTINDGTNWCQVFDSTFYPYHGYMDKETGNASDSRVNNIINHFHGIESNMRDELNKPEPNQERIENQRNTLKSFLEKLDCEEHWNEKYIPYIPPELFLYIKFKKIFKDEKTILQLRPMIYTYWS